VKNSIIKCGETSSTIMADPPWSLLAG